MNKKEHMDQLYLEGLQLQENGNFEEALVLFLRGSSMGDSGAQNAVGLAYDSGNGVQQDKKMAISWFKKAWRTSKYTGYCLNIALTYAEIGEGRRAIYWWTKAINLGDGSAALALAKFFMQTHKSKATDKVLSLLTRAVESREDWQISQMEREEAQELIADLV